MMIEDRLRCPEIAIAGLGYTKAEIDVVVGDLELQFVEPTETFIDRAFDHAAGCGDRADLVR
jgi:hypothetical protein